jgi:hypothetical protein
MSIGLTTAGPGLTAVRLKTPRAAAIAGIAFSILLASALVLLRLAVPGTPLDHGIWLDTDAERVAIAMNLIPFAGIAFLWFIGVLRARLAELEDQFFATVFLGSGLLFLAMLFVAAATAGAILTTHDARLGEFPRSQTFTLARAFAFNVMNIYALKVAAVFMISTSTVGICTGIFSRWIAYAGYALAAVLLVGGSISDWAFTVFPLWVFALSCDILFDNFRQGAAKRSDETT